MKKLNIAVLTVLLVFQTILSPISVFAETSLVAPINQVEQNLTEDSFTSQSEINESLNTEADTVEEISFEEPEIQQQEAIVNEAHSVTDPLSQPIVETKKPISQMVAETNVVDLASKGDTKLTLTIDSLLANSKDVLKDETFRPTKDQTVNVKYSFKIQRNATEDPSVASYDKDSFFKFQLPSSVIVFDSSRMSGNIVSKEDPTEVIATYVANDSGEVTVKINSALEPGNDLEGVIEFAAKFGDFSNETGLEQTLEIPLLGSEKVTKTYYVMPTTVANPDMTKKGTADRCDATTPDRCITWEIWVNKNGDLLKNPKIEDEIKQYQTLNSKIKVEQFNVGLAGVSNSGTLVGDYDSFPVNLANGETRDAFKITYKTKVTPKDVNTETQDYSNTARLIVSNGQAKEASDTVRINFGIALDKKFNSGNKYEANWSIKYNYLETNIEQAKAKIIDEIPNLHEYTDVKVYKIKLKSDGTEEARELQTKDTDYTLTTSSNSATKKNVMQIEFKNDIQDPYLIEYSTKATKDLITKQDLIDAGINGDKITNTVTAVNLGSTHKTAHIPNVKSEIGVKTHGAANYNNKTIGWTVTVTNENPTKPLPGPIVVTDTLPKGLTYVVNSAEIDGLKSEPTQSTNEQGQTILTWTIEGELKPSTSKKITYTTNFKTVGEVDGLTAYNNQLKIDFNDGSIAVATESTSATFKPDVKSTKNGFKTGNYDATTQQFTWGVGVNYNQLQLTDIKVTDTLGLGHYIDDTEATLKNSIEVYKMTPGTNGGYTVNKNEKVTSGWDIENIQKNDEGKIIGFTFAIPGPTSDAYYFTYKTKDLDDINGYLDIDGNPKDTYKNSAKISSGNLQWDSFEATAKVPNANNLLEKSSTINKDSGVITWKLVVNKSKSKLQNVTIFDTPSANQKILWDTFKIIRASGEEQIPEESIIKDNVLPNSFSYVVGNLDGEVIELIYQTYYDDVSGSNNYSNIAKLSFSGNIPSGQKAEQNKVGSFTWNDTDASGSSSRGTLGFQKIGFNNETATETIVQADGKSVFENVEFELWNRTGDVKLQGPVKANELGYFEFENVRYGMYRVKEVSSVPGYVNGEDAQGKLVTLKAETDIIQNPLAIQKYKNNEIITALKIIKLDASNNTTVLEGAEFNIFDSEDILVEGSPFKTDANGEIRVDLQPGEYSVVEHKAPIGYLQSTDKKSVTIDATQVNVKELKIYNISDGKEYSELEITKVNKDSLVDGQYQEFLPGAKFEVWSGNPSDELAVKLDEGITNADGKLKFKLLYGTYYLKEVTAPNGYDLKKSPYKDGKEIVLNNPKALLNIENEKILYGDIDLTKVDKASLNNGVYTKTLSGAKFELWNGDPTLTTSMVVASGTTDVLGKLKFNVEYGTYYLKEVAAPSGYDLNKSLYKDGVKVEVDNTSISLVIENERWYFPGGGWTPPVEPEEPTTPTDPETEPEEPTTPTDPEPTPEEPSNPEPTPEEPGTPSNPDDGEEPTTPTPKPEPTPTPEKPTPTPTPNPGPVGGNTGGSTPGTSTLPPKVVDITDKWKDKIEDYQGGKVSKDMLDDLMTLVEEYENMTQSNRKELEKLIDMDKVYEILIGAGKLTNADRPSFLPQTDGSFPVAWAYVGLMMVLVSAVMLIRRRKA